MGRTKVIIVVIVLGIAAGLFGGYRIWGTKVQGEGDVTQLLRNLEEAEWKAKEADAQKRAEVEQELRTAQEELKKKIAALEGGSRDLADRLQKAEQQIAEKEGLLAGLRNDLSEAREKASKGEEFRQVSQDLNARISELEKENEGLRSVIDNISEMTQRKQETR